VSVTFTAGVQKIWHPDPKIGFLAQAKTLTAQLPPLNETLTAAQAGGDANSIAAAKLALQTNRTLRFNNVLDAGVAGAFLLLVSIIVLFSLREWMLLLARKKAAELRETPPVWLPDYAVAESKPLNFFSLLAVGLALAKELSGEAQLERARRQQCACEQKSEAKIYTQVTEERFNGVRRCC
jgi:hypothetical protein